MKNLKFWMSLMVLALVATACGKKGGSTTTNTTTSDYYLSNGYCYSNSTKQQVHNSYCDSDSYNGKACNGYIYYVNCSQGYADRVDCTNNSRYVECQDPQAYDYPGETIYCKSSASFQPSCN